MRFVVTTGVLIALIGSPTLADADTSGFRAHLGCGKNKGAARSCPTGANWGAFFKAGNGVRTRYKLCVDPPEVYGSCLERATSRNGRDSVSLDGWRIPGTYVVTWKVGGDRVGRDRITLRSSK